MNTHQLISFMCTFALWHPHFTIAGMGYKKKQSVTRFKRPQLWPLFLWSQWILVVLVLWPVAQCLFDVTTAPLPKSIYKPVSKLQPERTTRGRKWSIGCLWGWGSAWGTWGRQVWSYASHPGPPLSLRHPMFCLMTALGTAVLESLRQVIPWAPFWTTMTIYDCNRQAPLLS